MDLSAFSSSKKIEKTLGRYNTAIGNIVQLPYSPETNQPVLTLTDPEEVYLANNYFVKLTEFPDFPSHLVHNPGVIWNNSSLPSASYWIDVAYGNGKFVAVSYANTNICATSSDGKIWQLRLLPSNMQCSKVIFGNGLFIVTSYDITTVYFTSPDGINWTQRSFPASGRFNVAHFANGMFLVYDYNYRKMYKSVDGLNWTSTGTDFSITNGYEFNGTFYYITNSYYARYYTTIDGVTFNQYDLASSITTSVKTAIAVYNDIIVVSLDNNYLVTSLNNGSTWQLVTNPSSEINYLNCFNGVFIATSQNSIYTSVDGINWITRATGSFGESAFGNDCIVVLPFYNINSINASYSLKTIGTSLTTDSSTMKSFLRVK